MNNQLILNISAKANLAEFRKVMAGFQGMGTAAAATGRQVRQALGGAGQALQIQGQAVQVVTRRMKEYRDAAGRMRDETGKFLSSTRAGALSLRGMGEAGRNAWNAIKSGITSAASVGRSALGGLAGIAGSLLHTVTSLAGAVGNTLAGAFKTLGAAALAAGAAIAGAFALAAKNGLDYNQTLRGVAAGLTVILGSEGAAGRLLGDLKQVAKDTQLTFKEVAKEGLGLAAAYGPQGVGRVIPTLKAFDAVQKALMVDTEAVKAAMLQFRKVIGQPFASADNLDEIAQNLPGLDIRGILKKKFGTADTEALKAAKITGRQVADALVDGMNAQFGTLSGARGLGVILSGFGDVFDEITGKMTQTFLPRLEAVVEKALAAFSKLAGNAGFIRALQVPFDLLAKALEGINWDAMADGLAKIVTEKNIVNFLADVVSWFKVLREQFTDFVAAVTGGQGIGNIFQGFGALVRQGIDIALKAWSAFTAAVDYLIQHAGEIGDAFRGGFKGVQEVLFGVLGILRTIAEIVIGIKVSGLLDGLANIKLPEWLGNIGKSNASGGPGGPAGAKKGQMVPGIPGYQFGQGQQIGLPRKLVTDPKTGTVRFGDTGEVFKGHTRPDPTQKAPYLFRRHQIQTGDGRWVPIDSEEGKRVDREHLADRIRQGQERDQRRAGQTPIQNGWDDAVRKGQQTWHEINKFGQDAGKAAIGAVPPKSQDFFKGFGDATRKGWENGGLDAIEAEQLRRAQLERERIRKSLQPGKAAAPAPGPDMAPGHAMGAYPGGQKAGAPAGLAGLDTEAFKDLMGTREASFDAWKAWAKDAAAQATEDTQAAAEAAEMIPILESELQNRLLPEFQRAQAGSKEWFKAIQEINAAKAEISNLDNKALKEAEANQKKAIEEAKKARRDAADLADAKYELAKLELENIPGISDRVKNRSLAPLLAERYHALRQGVPGETERERIGRLTEAQRVRKDLRESLGMGGKGFTTLGAVNPAVAALGGRGYFQGLSKEQQGILYNQGSLNLSSGDLRGLPPEVMAAVRGEAMPGSGPGMAPSLGTQITNNVTVNPRSQRDADMWKDPAFLWEFERIQADYAFRANGQGSGY